MAGFTAEGSVQIVRLIDGSIFFRADTAESLARKIDGICRKFAMKISAPREFYTVKIFGPPLFFGLAINRLSIAQVR